ncbi:MAG: phage Gp37/Gp68 family protein [Betaproteobacteria bacterium]|nr:phage Gp37/Gp68 family protein [Betaproteobacteria bacterium]MDH4322870.1 phage Gp37/Gp68 family protein [Betaproteobacteria bacterium]MDH5210546.1 phage Gp37/Gp68 family protein [Betaproteobacteria bacterium]
MSEKTGIAWTDSTFNPWWGCMEVSPGCDNCYARELAKRFGYGWGQGAPRRYFGDKHWNEPLRWNKAAGATGKRHLVFCASMADVFDNEVEQTQRDRLWALIRATPNLTWLLLTKRIGNVAKMHPGGDYPNVWLGASVVNQEEADRDIPKLLATPAAVRFVSYEPALGPVDWSKIKCVGADSKFNKYALDQLDWIIVGGESSQGGVVARPFNLAWARSTIEQCKRGRVPVFVKQLGSSPCNPAMLKHFKDRHGADPAEWPEDLRVQDFPE